MEQEHEIAQEVRARIHRAVQIGRRPVVALDLDLTLIDNSPRTRAIIVDFLQKMCPQALLSSSVAKANSIPLAFSISKNLEAVGVTEASMVEAGLAHWRERFFGDEWCAHDVAYPGAAESVRCLRDLGALVVYVTARISASQAVGTVQSLRAHGFPIAEVGTLLLMKPAAAVDDADFKLLACTELSRLGEVVFAVDNEPGHCHTFLDAFPSALVALMETRHSPTAPIPRATLPRIAQWTHFCASLAAA